MLTQHTDKVHLVIIEVPTVNAYIPGAKRMPFCISYGLFEWLQLYSKMPSQCQVVKSQLPLE